MNKKEMKPKTDNPATRGTVCSSCNNWHDIIYTVGKFPEGKKPMCPNCVKKEGIKVWSNNE